VAIVERQLLRQPSAMPARDIVTLCSGSALGRITVSSACPAS